jgi:hypothetical protein
MFHIVATIVALSSAPSMQYAGVPPFDTKAACEEHLASDAYKAAEEQLKQIIKRAADVDSEIVSACVEIEQLEK